MCAIKPAHKKRLIFDVYTSDSKMTKEEFNRLVLDHALKAEIQLNEVTRFRWHLKETKAKAD